MTAPICVAILTKTHGASQIANDSLVYSCVYATQRRNLAIYLSWT